MMALRAARQEAVDREQRVREASACGRERAELPPNEEHDSLRIGEAAELMGVTESAISMRALGAGFRSSSTSGGAGIGAIIWSW